MKTQQEVIEGCIDVLAKLEWHDEAEHPTLRHAMPVCPLCTGRGDRKMHYPGCPLHAALGEARKALAHMANAAVAQAAAGEGRE